VVATIFLSVLPRTLIAAIILVLGTVARQRQKAPAMLGSTLHPRSQANMRWATKERMQVARIINENKPAVGLGA
jgi:hypothetical protein